MVHRTYSEHVHVHTEMSYTASLTWQRAFSHSGCVHRIKSKSQKTSEIDRVFQQSRMCYTYILHVAYSTQVLPNIYRLSNDNVCRYMYMYSVHSSVCTILNMVEGKNRNFVYKIQLNRLITTQNLLEPCIKSNKINTHTALYYV